MTRVLRTLCAGLIATALGLPAGAGSGLIRLTDRDDLLGWEAVGRVEMGTDGYCTGTLIAPDLVLTAAHCVFDRAHRKREAATIRFRAGLRDGTAIAERTVSRFAVSDDYDPIEGVSLQSVRVDAALLELDQAIPSSLADPFVLHDGADAGENVSVVSYGRGRDDALSWQRECGVLGRGQGVMMFDCNVTFGSSGAPVFAKQGNRARILSLISAGSRTEDGPQSFGMTLPQVVSGLKSDLRAMPRATQGDTGFRRIKVGGGGGASGAKFAKP